MLDGDDASADRWIARRAGPDDAETVRSISAEAYAASYLPVFGYLPAPAMEDYGAHVAAGEVWFVEDGESPRPVGVAVLERHASHLLVYNLAVLPERWGEGIGRRLLALAEERARAEDGGAPGPEHRGRERAASEHREARPRPVVAAQRHDPQIHRQRGQLHMSGSGQRNFRCCTGWHGPAREQARSDRAPRNQSPCRECQSWRQVF